MTATSRVVIGIDAGATKTAAIAGLLDGGVLDRLRTGPSAIVGLPDDEALAVLRGVVDRLAPDRARIAHIVIGLSGVDFPDEHPEQHRRVANALEVPRERLLLVNDGVVALAGAAGRDRATLVQHGTEVTTAWRERLGGETVFDSVGVADVFDVRLKAVPAVARMLDGRATVTPLCARVLEHCGVTAAEFPRWMMRDPAARERILRLAPVVFEAWREGDATASRLVGRAVEDYVVTTLAMAARLKPGPFQACFGGGTIAQGGEALVAAIGERLARERPDAVLATPAASPEEGALVLARHAARDASARFGT
ncbi:BadF/BadG/BcrA/BcrD ATPase family protein [Phenylobacterium sp.]|uniref:N-acetylglucosamine kinase n=1 Tax=Phenylobacterium sp. TaxID=1871053 RepID=UPI0025D5C09A|nr:BadF/BadG/BcrA/BcrD ATPase family protein [Phenylobacterium sp.]